MITSLFSSPSSFCHIYDKYLGENFAKSSDPDQTISKEQSDLDLHHLPTERLMIKLCKFVQI